MNIRLGKSFGLAFVVAVGILALMFALGTFNAQKAGAQVLVNSVTVTPNSAPAGGDVVLTVGVDVAMDGIITSGQQLAIALPGFTVPSTIDPSTVSITTGAKSGKAATVEVSDTTVTVEVGNDSAGEILFASSGKVYVIFTKAAGIKAGGQAGVENVLVNGLGSEDASNAFSITPSVSLSHSIGFTDTELKVTGASFPEGTVEIRVNATGTGTVPTGGTAIASDVRISGGTFEHEFTSIPVGTATNFEEFTYGDNYIWVTHLQAVGDELPESARAKAQKFVLSAEIIAPDELVTGDEGKEVEVKQGPEGAIVVSVTIGGTAVPFAPKGVTRVVDGNDVQVDTKITHTSDAADAQVTERTLDGEGEIILIIDVENVKVGSDLTLAVIASDVTTPPQLGTTKVNVASLSLNVNPSTAMVGREVTVTGSGFTGRGNVLSIDVGIAPVCDSTPNNDVADCDIDVASGGRVVAAFNIPNVALLKEAEAYPVTITDSGGRIGKGKVTIPEPTLNVDPPESRIGSTINLSGTGWPTGTGASLVGLYYDGVQYASATTDSSGEWSGSITVPNDAGVGDSHDVEAKATVGSRESGSNDLNNVTQKESHKTPDAVVTLSPAQAQRGDTITVSGENFHIFEAVTIEVAGSDVAPGGTTTDGDGSFTAEVLVPGLGLGNKNLKVTVRGVPVVEFLEIVATPVSTTMTSEEAFADLTAANNLIVVWYFDNDTKGWSFYDPRPEVAAAVDLDMVSKGDNVWVQITADQMFQGKPLTAGWNLHTLQ